MLKVAVRLPKKIYVNFLHIVFNKCYLLLLFLLSSSLSSFHYCCLPPLPPLLIIMVVLLLFMSSIPWSPGLLLQSNYMVQAEQSFLGVILIVAFPCAKIQPIKIRLLNLLLKPPHEFNAYCFKSLLLALQFIFSILALTTSFQAIKSSCCYRSNTTNVMNGKERSAILKIIIMVILK